MAAYTLWQSSRAIVTVRDSGSSKPKENRRMTIIIEEANRDSYRRRLRDTLKQALTQVGAASSLRALSSIDTALNYLRVGHWMREKGFHVPRRAKSREQIFALAAEKVRDLDVLYLEFGVYGGTSIRLWSQLLRNPRSKLHGFDSFEGLPEAWGTTEKGHFNTGGSIPKIDGPRVSFFQGWFSDTLPKYTPPSHDAVRHPGCRSLFLDQDGAGLHQAARVCWDVLLFR
jgi:hypothetical protein